MPVKVAIKRLAHSKGLALPNYQTAFAAGADLAAAIEGEQILKPQERALIPTGFCLGLPAGYEAQIRARSGLSTKHGITLINAIGTIDQDYRGEIKVALVNLSQESWTLKRGERIAQIIIAPYIQGEFFEAETLDQSVRGAGGFGSTGGR